MVSESPCRTGKPRRATGLKGKVVWPGSSHRRPTGDQDSLCWTGKDRKVKLGSREALAVTRLEMEARSLDG